MFALTQLSLHPAPNRVNLVSAHITGPPSTVARSLPAHSTKQTTQQIPRRDCSIRPILLLTTATTYSLQHAVA